MYSVETVLRLIYLIWYLWKMAFVYGISLNITVVVVFALFVNDGFLGTLKF